MDAHEYTHTHTHTYIQVPHTEGEYGGVSFLRSR